MKGEDGMVKKLAIIGSGEMAVIIAENARKMGVYTYSFSNNNHDRVTGISDEHHCVDIFDIETIKSICADSGVDGVIATTELTIQIAAKIAHLLGLNGMPVDVSEKITDKAYVRQKVSGLKTIKQPSFIIHKRGRDIPIINKYPVIVKPTSMGGKRGITVVYNEVQLREAIDYAFESMPIYKNKIIIEGFLEDGMEYSVESLSYHGKHKVIQITEKISSGPPHCVELGHIQPSNISENLHNRVELAIKDVLTVTGVDNSSSHTEIKIINNEIYLIELNARLGGDHIAYPLTELSTGYPYIQGNIQIAIDNFIEPDLNQYIKKYCGVLFVAEQTAYLRDLFEKCENYSWLYKKNKITDKLIEIINNHSFDTNYMIYLSDKGIPHEIKMLLEKNMTCNRGG